MERAADVAPVPLEGVMVRGWECEGVVFVGWEEGVFEGGEMGECVEWARKAARKEARKGRWVGIRLVEVVVVVVVDLGEFMEDVGTVVELVLGGCALCNVFAW